MESEQRAARSDPKREKSAPDRRSAAPHKAPWFVVRAIRALPEAEQFDSEQQRDEAIGEIHGDVSPFRGLDFWIGIAVFLGVVVPVFYGLRVLRRAVNWHPTVEEILTYAALFATAGVTLWFLWRWGARQDLRAKLIARGIPVCRGCGYSLRGQTADSTKCPECGREIDAEVARILASSKLKLGADV